MQSLPRLLQQYQVCIQASEPDQHSVAYRQSHWQRTINNNNLASIIDLHPLTISRGNVQSLATLAYVNRDPDAIVRLFLASMVWGYGEVGYGPYRTQKMLDTSDFSTTVEDAFTNIISGNVHTAYVNFNLPMCGSAFFTKFFYFAGLGSKQAVCPVILDSVIARCLEEKLDLDISQYAQVVRNSHGRITSVGRYADGYSRYINMMHEWAEQLHCRPDSIEFVLFTLT